MKKKLFSAFLFSLFIVFPLALTAQDYDSYIDDPEVKKLMKSYQDQAQNVPAELLAMKPAGLTATGTNYNKEMSENSTISFSLDMNSDKEYCIVKLIYGAYNLKSDIGKMTAKNAGIGRKQDIADRMKEFRARKEDWKTWYEPKVTAVPNGKMFIQKIFSDKHGDGEGDVPAETVYQGLLFLDREWDFVTVEVGPIKDSAQVEKWLKHVADKASKLSMEKLFK